MIQSSGHADSTGVGINGKATIGIISKAEGHGITVCIRGVHLTDHRALLCVLTHLTAEHQGLLVNIGVTTVVAAPDHLDGAIGQFSDRWCLLITGRGVVDQYRITCRNPAAIEQPGVNTLAIGISGDKRCHKAITNRHQLYVAFGHDTTVTDGNGSGALGAIVVPALDVPGAGTFIAGSKCAIAEFYHPGEVTGIVVNTGRCATKGNGTVNTVATGIEYLQLAAVGGGSVFTPGYGKTTVIEGRDIR